MDGRPFDPRAWAFGIPYKRAMSAGEDAEFKRKWRESFVDWVLATDWPLRRLAEVLDVPVVEVRAWLDGDVYPDEITQRYLSYCVCKGFWARDFISESDRILGMISGLDPEVQVVVLLEAIKELAYRAFRPVTGLGGQDGYYAFRDSD